MENTFTISADIDTSSAESTIGLEVWVDNKLAQDINPVTGPMQISVDVEDTDGVEHELKFVLKNKLPEHTKIDDAGNIVQDTVITVGNLKFDEIELGHVFYEQAVYHHNFNGNGTDTADKFYGTMGCNGSVVLKFSTPMYLWLLENM